MRTSVFLKFFGLLFLWTIGACNQSSDNSSKGIGQAKESDSIVSENDIPFYVGTYTRTEGHVDGQADGVHLAFLNPDNGSMRLQATYPAGPNPSYLAVHPTGRFLYAVNEIGGQTNEPEGSVTALNINEDYSLAPINSKYCKGIAPCHISFANHGVQVLVANYVTGSITSFPLAADGRLAGAQNLIKYKGGGPTDRQESPHAHYVRQLSDGLIISADLGSDSIRFHRFDSGQLTYHGQSLATEPGAGPRHIEVHPNLPVLYVVNELNATISSFRRNMDNAYQPYQTVSTLPEETNGEGHCAAIKITKDGRFLYVSNRGDFNNIAIYKVDDEGALEMVSHQSSLGNVPRDIEISPDDRYLLAANQNSDNIVSFKINQENGLLSQPIVLNNIPTPVNIQFLN